MAVSLCVAAAEICELGSIGTSTEGRDLMIVTVTDSSTGAAASKPAFWLDGNTHAGEVTGCEACLHFLHALLSDYAGGDASTKLMLATSAIYVVPRVSPDGAELYLTTEHSLRASTILWPNAEPPPGFQTEDMTGNGEALLMRIKDPVGSFKVCPEDPRLLMPRAPQDNDPSASYYHLLPEGEYKDYDGFTKQASTRWGLDTNRQYPAGAHRQRGSTQPTAAILPTFLNPIFSSMPGQGGSRASPQGHTHSLCRRQTRY